MISRTSKCSTLCKLLISHGVPDEEMFDTIVALTAFYKNRPLSQRREIAVAHNVTPHVAKSNYRQRYWSYSSPSPSRSLCHFPRR